MAGTFFEPEVEGMPLSSAVSFLEAHSRRNEAMVHFFRTRARKLNISDQERDAFMQRAEEVDGKSRFVTDKLNELMGTLPPKDPEGTAPTLADSAGNYAKNSNVARAGGIHVIASNTAGVELGDPPADDPEEAVRGSRLKVPALSYGVGGAVIGAMTDRSLLELEDGDPSQGESQAAQFAPSFEQLAEGGAEDSGEPSGGGASRRRSKRQRSSE